MKGEARKPAGEMHFDRHFGRIHAGKRAAVQHGERHTRQAFGFEPLASNSAMRASSAVICSRERASSLAWTSNSSRVTKSNRPKKFDSSARKFFSASLAGDCASSALILALNSSNNLFCCIKLSFFVALFQSITADTTRQKSNRLIALSLCNADYRRTKLMHPQSQTAGEFA